MKKNYYLFNPGRMSRKDNTLRFVRRDEDGMDLKPLYLPIEGIDNLYVFGSIDANSALYTFLGKHRVSVHFFDYYEHYRGSFMPKDYLLAGKMQIQQTIAYLNSKKRMHIAGGLIDGATANILRNLKYYHNRDLDLSVQISQITEYRFGIHGAKDVPALMGVEGNCRQSYYTSWADIIKHFDMNGRDKQPPSNEVNALLSFANMVCYTTVLGQIYHTQLNPTISFLHEPGARRYSLALDIAEIFKPMLVDRLIFRLLNRRELRQEHFDKKLNACYLSDSGRKIFLKAWEERLKETIKHRKLKKKVSYKHLIKLECYKISKYILDIVDNYEPFKIWW